MSVIFKDNIFTIETKNTMYQMKADKFGVLLHLWYGKKTCLLYTSDAADE